MARDDQAAQRNGKPLQKRPSDTELAARTRDEVLRDFRKIAGPLRGRNRGRSPKS